MLKYAVVLAGLIIGLSMLPVSADDFGIPDAHVGFGGIASSSSPSFQLVGVIGGIAVGSSSASSFGLLGGLLYVSVITLSPIPTPTSTTSPPPGGGGGGGGIAFFPATRPQPMTCPKSPDFSADGRVDLVDFSVLAFWWGKRVLPTAPYDLNCDGRVNLTDFSILLFSFSASRR